jgi:hypothetical protein
MKRENITGNFDMPSCTSLCLKRNADCFFIDALWQPSGLADCEGVSENAFGVIDNLLRLASPLNGRWVEIV